jgi:hypothetical protein
MVRNNRPQQGGNVTPPAPDGNGRQAVDHKWEQLVRELHASSGNCPQDLDEIAVARYLSGRCSGKECEHVQETIAGSQTLTDSLALARQVLEDMEPAA